MPTFAKYSYWDSEPITQAKIKELNGNLPEYWVDLHLQFFNLRKKEDFPARFRFAYELLDTIKDDSHLLMLRESEEELKKIHDKLISARIEFHMTSIYADQMDHFLFYNKSYTFGIFNFDSKEDAMLAKLIIGKTRSLEVEEYRRLFRET